MTVKKEEHVAGETGALRSDSKGKGRYDCILIGYPHMMFRLARHLENGVDSGYAPENWRKGSSLRRFLEGAFRHLCQFADGLTDEDHLTAAIWGLMSLGEIQHLVAEQLLPSSLNDLPKPLDLTVQHTDLTCPRCGAEARHRLASVCWKCRTPYAITIPKGTP